MRARSRSIDVAPASVRALVACMMIAAAMRRPSQLHTAGAGACMLAQAPRPTVRQAQPHTHDLASFNLVVMSLICGNQDSAGGRPALEWR